MEHAFSVGPTLASTNLAAAVLPSGRSIRSNGTATVFATIVNGGTQAAEGCTIQPDTPLYADFSFQPTDPATNALIGTPNVPVRIAAGAAQSFVLSFKPNASAVVAKATTTVLRFKCTNTAAAPVYDGVNTLLLSFDPSSVPDVVPIAATVSGDGVVRVPGASGIQAWSAASVNIGAAATLTVQPQLAGTTVATVTVCETNSSSGACLAAPTANVSASFTTNSVRTFALFVQAGGAIAFDPANTRIQLNFVDSSGVIRGQTSVALTTQ
jgi:hypothetical protein